MWVSKAVLHSSIAPIMALKPVQAVIYQKSQEGTSYPKIYEGHRNLPDEEESFKLRICLGKRSKMIKHISRCC